MTDYSSKFDFKGLINRNFCAPFVWTSEAYTPELIIIRTQAYALRTYHWLTAGSPTTLAACIAQEDFVHRQLDLPAPSDRISEQAVAAAYYEAHRTTTDYNRIFNFLYGDTAARELGYPAFGVTEGMLGL